MLNFLSTFGADSQFEKNRLLLTKPNLEAPNQQCMKNLLQTFAGQDQQTRSQIAFASVLRKLHCSNNKENWLYLLKNLIILDRVMCQNRFCQEIEDTYIQTVENYKNRDNKTHIIGAERLLKKYWQLIKNICRYKISKKHILFYKRSQRKNFLETLKISEILKEIKLLQVLFEDCLQLVFSTSGVSNQDQQNQRRTQVVTERKHKYYRQFTRSKLAQYLTFHFYSKLLTFFSCQYLCIHKFIQIMIHTTKNQNVIATQDAREFKKMIYRFKINSNDMILLAQNNRQRKGFEHIEVKEFSAFSQEHIIQAIDNYVNQEAHQSFSMKKKIQPLIVNPENFQRQKTFSNFLNVDRKPFIYEQLYNNFTKSPRKLIQCQKQEEDSGSFQNYFNSYCESFPHKNMMTIDLIQDIRKDELKKTRQMMSHMKKLQYESSQQEKSFFKQFKQLKTQKGWKDILIFAGLPSEQTEMDEEQNRYSQRYNSAQRTSIYDILGLKWTQGVPN